MNQQADVKSIDTLAFVKTAFASFAHETGQALAEIEMQGQRAVEYICVDRAAYWKAEIRRMSDLVNKAIKDLELLARAALDHRAETAVGSSKSSPVARASRKLLPQKANQQRRTTSTSATICSKLKPKGIWRS